MSTSYKCKMKIISIKEKGYLSYIDRFELDGAYAGKNIPLGILLMFVFIKDCGVDFIELDAEAEGERGEPHNILNVSDDKLFENLDNLVNVFSSQELRIWDLKCMYNSVEICISGWTHGSIIYVSSPITSTINFIPLMNAAENATYNYHDYDQEMVEAIKKKFNMNQKVTIRNILSLERYPDIYSEFISGMKEQPFGFRDNGTVEVEGYTARELFESYPLSELGAYNYLIYLRENPKAALQNLKDGLPRK